MRELLQELWDEYCALVGVVGEATDDAEIDENNQALVGGIIDNPKMIALRGKLYDIGIKNIPARWICKYCGENEKPRCHQCVREDGKFVTDELVED